MHRIASRAVALLAISFTLTACARQDAATDSTKVAQSGATDGPRVVTITAKDFAYVAPDTISSGMTTFRLVNDGTTLHHAMIARLDSGKTMADLMAAMKHPGPPPRWMVVVGGPNAPDPKAESNATFEIQPGNYAILCMVDIPGGIPHVTEGMMKPLTVVPATGAVAAAPIADDTIALADYAFRLRRPLSAGHHTFRVMNTAAQPHEVELVKFAPGKSVKDLVAWMKDPKGPPPGNAIGGVAPTVNGTPIFFTADITPGDYLLVCFVPDAKDGKAHMEHGMSLLQTVQ